jgi:hypothetical protein
VVVECQYELEDDDSEAVISVFGPKVLKGKTLKRNTHYGKSRSTFSLSTDEAGARKHLIDNPALPDELKTALTKAADWNAFTDALDEAEATEAVNALKGLVAKVREKGLASYIFDFLIWPRAPK